MTLLLAAAGSALAAGPAAAEIVTIDRAVERSCTARALEDGAGYVQRTVAGPAAGSVSARLEGAAGDWDLAVFDRSGRLVAGSAYRGGHEVATGYHAGGGTLTVQACRVAGAGSTAELDVDTNTVDATRAQPSSLVRVSTPTRARAQRLADLGLDVTEHGGPGYVEVVLHGAADARKLATAGFVYTTEIADLTARSRADRRADRAFAAATAASDLPSGRTTYRRLHLGRQ